jgi:hypothetical protein
MPAPTPPVRILVAAGVSRPGVARTLADAEGLAREGAPVSVLFTEDGLDALEGEWPARLAAAGARTSLCARSARARKVNPVGLPQTVLWSSLTAFLRDIEPDARVWTLFP